MIIPPTRTVWNSTAEFARQCYDRSASGRSNAASRAADFLTTSTHGHINTNMKSKALILALILAVAATGEALHARQMSPTDQMTSSEREAAARVSDNLIRQIAERHDRDGSQVRMTLTENNNYEAGIGLMQSLNVDLKSEDAGSNQNIAGIQQWGDSGLASITQRDGIGNRGSVTQFDDHQTADINQTGYRNSAQMIQAGGNNTGLIYQDGTENEGRLIQDGYFNTALMYITGKLNRVNVSQIGNENQFRLNLEGDENAVDVTQDGEHNLYERFETGDAVLNERVQQIGNNNLSRQFGSLSGGRSANIIQEGDGLQLIIRHEQ